MKNNVDNFKTDLKPIWIYFVGLFVSVTFMAFVFAILGIKSDYLNLYQILCEGLISVVFFVMYFKIIKRDIKRLSLKQYVYIIIFSLILIGINELISELFIKLHVAMNNQDAVLSLMESYKIPTIFLIVLFGPIAEEFVFRYSFSTFIHNDILFLIVSSLAFAIIHGVGIVTILYLLLGIAFGFIYLKTNKNIVASTIAHILNNLVSVIMIFLSI